MSTPTSNDAAVASSSKPAKETPAATPISSTFPTIRKGASFLLAWQLKDRRVLLIGGGLVASGRLYYLLEAGAHVTIVAPSDRLHPEVRHRIDTLPSSDLTYVDRDFKGVAPVEDGGDDLRVEQFDMVLTAIDSVGLSREICLECRRHHIPVNVADVPSECDFYFGSQFRRGPLQVMVSTSGRGPKIAAMLRQRLEASLPDDIEQAIDSVGKLRSELRTRAPGTGGQLGQERMKWMIAVCDAWRLDELADMSADTRKVLLDEGWEKGRRALGPAEVGARGGWCSWLFGGRLRVKDLDVSKCPSKGAMPALWLAAGAGFAAGLAVPVVGLLAGKLRWHR